MHTATQLNETLFDVSAEGVPLSRADVFPAWGASDRLGVMVDRPLGAVGASLLMQLAITSYYDHDPVRRSTPLYPEIYLFHAGEYFGSHGYYDVYPARKEVVVPDDPAVMLEAINDRAITRLVVVDGPSDPVIHHYKEPAIATERIVDAYAYHPGGRVSRPDFQIRATGRAATANTTMTLHPKRTYAERMAEKALDDKARDEDPMSALPDDESLPPNTYDYLANEVPSTVLDTIVAGRKQISERGLPCETYRRVSVVEALRMLHRRSDTAL